LYRTAQVTIFDMMDKQHVAVTVRTYEFGAGADMHNDLENLSITVDGTGEQDGHRWLADALVALIEAL